MMFLRRSPAPAPPPESLGESLEAAEDILFDFFDFFDRTVDRVYAHIFEETKNREITEDILVDSYFSLLQRRRFFFWRRGVEESALASIIDRAIGAARKRQERGQGNIPRSIQTAVLTNEQKEKIRMALLAKYRRARMTNVQFVMPATAIGTVAACFVLFSTVFLQPLSAGGTIRRLAAAEVLLLAEERSYGRELLAVEEAIRGIGAHYAGRDLARITLALAPPAIDKQLTLENEVQAILWHLGTRPFRFGQTRSLLLSSIVPAVSAEADILYDGAL